MATTARNFGETLKEFRETRGIRQHELRDRTGYNQSHISRLESGLRAPTPDAIEKLSSGLELNASEELRLLIASGLLPPALTRLIERFPFILDFITVLDQLQQGPLYLGSFIEPVQRHLELAKDALKRYQTRKSSTP